MCRHLANWTKHMRRHNVSHCRQTGTEPRPRVTSIYRKFDEISTCGFYPRDAMLARYVLSSRVCRLSIRHKPATVESTATMRLQNYAGSGIKRDNC